MNKILLIFILLLLFTSCRKSDGIFTPSYDYKIVAIIPSHINLVYFKYGTPATIVLLDDSFFLKNQNYNITLSKGDTMFIGLAATNIYNGELNLYLDNKFYKTIDSYQGTLKIYN